jgi:YVTN family beta-propeller protein
MGTRTPQATVKASLAVAWVCLPALACSSPPTAPDRIFVSQAGSSTIAVIDGTTGAREAHIDVGMLPHDLVLSPDRKTCTPRSWARRRSPRSTSPPPACAAHC